MSNQTEPGSRRKMQFVQVWKDMGGKRFKNIFLWMPGIVKFHSSMLKVHNNYLLKFNSVLYIKTCSNIKIFRLSEIFENFQVDETLSSI